MGEPRSPLTSRQSVWEDARLYCPFMPIHCERDGSSGLLERKCRDGVRIAAGKYQILFVPQPLAVCSTSCQKNCDVLSTLPRCSSAKSESYYGISVYVFGSYKSCFWGSVFMHGFSSDRRRKLFRHVSKWSCFDSRELRGSSIPTTGHHVLHIYQQIRICHTQIFLKKPK